MGGLRLEIRTYGIKGLGVVFSRKYWNIQRKFVNLWQKHYNQHANTVEGLCDEFLRVDYEAVSHRVVNGQEGLRGQDPVAERLQSTRDSRWGFV